MSDDPAGRAVQAADPATPQAILADLAHRHPELRSTIAANPACYDDLRDWIARQPAEAPTETFTRTVIASRQTERISVQPVASDSPAEEPHDGARRPRIPIAAWTIAGGLVLAGGIVAGAIALSLPQSAPSDSGGSLSTLEPEATAVESEPRPTTDTLPQLPVQPVSVQFDGFQAIDGVQVFADAIVSTSTDQLIRNCWTYAPETIRDRYGTDQARGAILEAFTHPGQIGQSGAQWQGDLVTVVFTNEELYSRYPCPVVRIAGEPDTYDRIDAEHLVTRLAGRLTGNPIDSDDVETQYFIECSADPLFPWTLDGATEPPVEVDRTPIDAAVLSLAGQRLAVEQISTDVDPSTRYWRLTAVGTSGPSLIVQTWGIRACVGAAG